MPKIKTYILNSLTWHEDLKTNELYVKSKLFKLTKDEEEQIKGIFKSRKYKRIIIERYNNG